MAEPARPTGGPVPTGRAQEAPAHDGAAGQVGRQDGPSPEGVAAPSDGLALARRALARAREEAAAKGLRPGTPAPARVRDRRREGAGGLSGPGPDDRDPQPLGGSVDRLLRERGWTRRAQVGSVLGRWEEVVGPEVASHAVPEHFEDGELRLRADSTAWATQLRLLAPQLRRTLDERVGRGTVKKITVLGPSGPSWRRGRLHVRGRGPRDTYG